MSGAPEVPVAPEVVVATVAPEVVAVLRAVGGALGVPVSSTAAADGGSVRADDLATAAVPHPVLSWDHLDAAGLRRAAAGVQAAIAALEHQQRLLLGLIEGRRAFTVDGARDTTEWATGTLGVDRRTAHDAVTTGRRLARLPRLAQRAAAGQLTADQVRPASMLAELDGHDTQWADQAPHLPASVLRRRLARARRPGAADHRAARNARHLRTWEAGHELRFGGSLPIDDGRRLLAAVERAMPERDPHALVPDTAEQRRADGLLALSAARLADDADPDRATVVLFAELAAVCDDHPAATAELEQSQPVATDTARRLLCDSRVQLVVQDRDGIAVGVGTTQRTVSPQTRRALVHRDGRCRFGSCSATRFLHAHHVVHWPSPTTMGNLALLCWTHHHAVHEGGWSLTGDPNGELVAEHQATRRRVTSWPQAPRGPAPPPPTIPPTSSPPTAIPPTAIPPTAIPPTSRRGPA